jgi:peptidoglycan L-alanyl-D-glutamate endopeptidase CwlK
MEKSSRNPELMHPLLKERVFSAFKTYESIYPNDPVPFVTDVYRNREDQERAFKEKKSNARFGQSLHNYIPAYAVDVAFKDNRGRAIWDYVMYRRLAFFMKKLGLVWGGDWKMPDNPHFELPMTWQDARAGRVPKMKPRYTGTIVSAQECLQWLGFFPDNVAFVENFGPITQKAVREFQVSYKLHPTGVNNIGPATRMKLLELFP